MRQAGEPAGGVAGGDPVAMAGGGEIDGAVRTEAGFLTVQLAHREHPANLVQGACVSGWREVAAPAVGPEVPLGPVHGGDGHGAVGGRAELLLPGARQRPAEAQKPYLGTS